ncbi:tryptophan 7-halogenase [Paraneptunicella aestuarii]|uniref:tryptophan halogenase family protein n=1 Tax=Paraneptunicella aestuarii TaxID=2831148 RepID=UPI001E46A2ED|nr:tryptophan halogenase family protein [Paraneptunicella aestuarii]UAA40571.1 tryptophan 7-halogenase [Paraneptunicella aestuarii]
MNSQIKNVVVLGGGTAGWMSAALLKKVLGNNINLTLVESESIGTVGVGEATIPPIRLVNNVLGLNEAEFIRETKATIKLAIKFENWKKQGESYFHTFGAPGKSIAFCHFHHYWQRAKQLGDTSSLWEYDLNYLCCQEGKFAQINSKDPILELPFSYHFDASLYAQYLRKLSEQMGVTRIEGLVKEVHQDPENGYISELILSDDRVVSGDLFIDCSGFKGLLIQEKLGAGYEDWSHWLPCDSALAIPSERHEKTAPYTRSIAHDAGWQWRIPLQHRNGNGLVYSSLHYSQQQAEDLLLSNLDTQALGEPKLIRFKTGRRRKQWHRNVVAVGLSSGFLEPLESTSIHLIQSAIVRLIQLFPHNGIAQADVAEYNKQSKLEFEQIRDFLILHYHVNQRDDSQFWRDMQEMEIPDSLTHKMELFRATGRLFKEQNDLFQDSSWLQVMLGQGIEPQDYHPLANSMTDQQLLEMLANMKRVKMDPLPKLPEHDAFLKQLCGNM